MKKVHIIVGSTRPGRVGKKIGEWVHDGLRQRSDAEYALIDLAEVNLPMLDESKHPAFGQYEQAHTQEWSEIITEADAYVIVTAEYNHGYPASLKNALDYLYNEWRGKPVAFVSYGGVAGGTRAVQQLRQVVIELNMVPIREQVNIPFITEALDEDGRPKDERHDEQLQKTIDQLVSTADRLAPATV